MSTTSSTSNHDVRVALYQRLVDKEFENYERNEKKIKYPTLSSEDVASVIKDVSQELKVPEPEVARVFNDLITQRYVYNVNNQGYATAHFDLIYRIINLRSRPDGSPKVLDYKIDLLKECYPDFGAESVSNVLSVLSGSLKPLEYQELLSLLGSLNNYMLSSFQAYIIRQIFDDRNNVVPIVAPTASGKTISFLIPAIVYLLRNKINKVSGKTTAVLVYPRKALAVDQLNNYLRIIHEINERLVQKGYEKIYVAIDDGDTPSSQSGLQDNKPYRNLKCPKCDEPLIYSAADKSLICKNCNVKYDYIRLTKQDIRSKGADLVITNLWTFLRRIIDSQQRGMIAGADYIVFDEAHVYQDTFMATNLFFILRLYEVARRQVTGKADLPKIVFSSATFVRNSADGEPGHVSFINYVMCGKAKGISNILTFEEFYARNGCKSGKYRYQLLLHLLPNADTSSETVTEDAAMVSLLWLLDHNWKGIVFGDSISGVDTFFKYFDKTILGTEKAGRKARELIAHMCYTNNDSYYWPYYNSAISKFKINCATDPDSGNKKFAEYLKERISYHYSLRSLEERAKIEKEFKKGNKNLLFSTSTLELGIDISDIALVIQHKLPIQLESLTQRVGRAGRGTDTFRVAMGVLTLQNSPIATLFMYNDPLRKALIRSSSYNVLSLAKRPYSNSNVSLLLQYILLLELMKGGITKIGIPDDITNISPILDELKALLEKIKSTLDSSEERTKLQEELLCGKDLGNKIINKLKIEIDNIIPNIDTIKDLLDRDVVDSSTIPTDIIWSLKSYKDGIQNEILEIEDRPLPEDMNNSIRKFINQVKDIIDRLEDLLELIQRLNNEPITNNIHIDKIINLLEKKRKLIEEKIERVKKIEVNVKPANKLTRLSESGLEAIVDGIRRHMDRIKEELDRLGKEINSGLLSNRSDTLVKQANNIKKEIEGLIENYKKRARRDANVIDFVLDLITILSYNRMFTSLLLLPPSPTITLELQGEDSYDEL